jgi:hypothetical protein
VPIPPPITQEFGTVECVQILRTVRHGGMQPLLCTADDNARYVVKPFSSGGAWPQVLEWVCARLGRSLGLPIPNYRQIMIGEELADAWNATNARQVEPGLGFGSQFVEGASECDEALLVRIEPTLTHRLRAFDWWIRNRDRILKNPNLLWSYGEARPYVIDHEQAGQTDGADAFWRDHLFANATPTPWLPADLRSEMQVALLLKPNILAELPSTWTTGTDGVDWFFKQLEHSIATTPHPDWRNYE